MELFKFAQITVGPLIRAIFGIKASGVENMPKEGAVVLCSNHRSNSDPIILGAALKRPLCFMAKAELFKVPVLRSIIKWFGAFPVTRGRGDIDAMRKGLKVLKDGKVLAMFPEGTRYKELALPKAFKPGAAQFAYKTKAGILPAAVLSKGNVRPFKRNIVKFGKLIPYEELGFTDGSRENLNDVTKMIREKVIELWGDSDANQTR